MIATTSQNSSNKAMIHHSSLHIVSTKELKKGATAHALCGCAGPFDTSQGKNQLTTGAGIVCPVCEFVSQLMVETTDAEWLEWNAGLLQLDRNKKREATR